MCSQAGEGLEAMKAMKTLDKTELSKFLEGLRADFRVITPLQEGEDLLFGEFDSSKLAVNFTGRPIIPPKEYLFPQQERLFTFTAEEGDRVEVKAYLNEEKQVIWGIRPCDLCGIKTLDSIFLSNYVDTYYQARRENTILMGLNCNQACETGFCNSLQTGPFAKDSFDLLFTDLANRYLVEVGSKAGEAMIARRANLFTEASDEDKGEANRLEEKSKQGFKPLFDMKGVDNKLAQAWDDRLWAEESDSCILCGGCNFVCPTCHCFNIEDNKAGRESERIRYWDSCQLGGFTQMAAENTRQTQGERLRQRIYHKFSYTPAKYDGAIGCSGCGRCIEVCPSNIDITHILERVIKR